jgi:hypothetical protein
VGLVDGEQPTVETVEHHLSEVLRFHLGGQVDDRTPSMDITPIIFVMSVFRRSSPPEGTTATLLDRSDQVPIEFILSISL